jgi:hypothetical protein
MYAQRKKAAATEAHSKAISDRGARFGGRPKVSRSKRIQPAVSLTPPKGTALYNKTSAVCVVLNLVNPVLPRGGLEGGVNLGELIKLIVKVLDDVLHLNRG